MKLVLLKTGEVVVNVNDANALLKNKEELALYHLAQIKSLENQFEKEKQHFLTKIYKLQMKNQELQDKIVKIKRKKRKSK